MNAFQRTLAATNTVFFIFNDTATPAIYTLSLHDALPISLPAGHKFPSAKYGLLRKMLEADGVDRKSTRLNSSHVEISYAVFCLKKESELPTRTSTYTPCKREHSTGSNRWLAASDNVFGTY